MAIDTDNKRNSAMLDPGQMPWPPDGAISVDDRLVMLEFYSGIAATSAPPTVPTTPFILRMRARFHKLIMRPR